MTGIESALVWCAVEAAIVASLGIAAAWVLRRRNATGAATAAAAAVATIAIATTLAPVRWPATWVTHGEVSRPTQTAGVTPYVESSTIEPAERGVRLMLGDLMDLMRKLEHKPATPASGYSLRRAVSALLIAGSALGLVQFAMSLHFLRRLRNASRLVECPATLAAFDSTRRALRLRRPISLVETSLVQGPATMGWRRPVVLLPHDRTNWTPLALCACLAHELCARCAVGLCLAIGG